MDLSTHSGIETLDPSLVPLWVSESAITQLFRVATTTVLVYHTNKEVKYFWGARLNSVTVVYFANRYIGILGAVSSLFWVKYGATLPLCNFTIWTSVISAWFTIIVIEYILMIRVLALYSQAKCLVQFLGAFLGLEAIIGLVTAVYSTVIEDNFVIGLGPEGPLVCEYGLSPIITPLGIIFWAIPVVFGLLLMALALYKAAEYWRMSRRLKGFNLVKVLIVDQAIYFTLVVSCSMLNMIRYKLVISNYTFVAQFVAGIGSPSFLCVMGSIMLFNLKEAGERGLNQGTSYRTSSVSAMAFA